jgi:hypothetical protein
MFYTWIGKVVVRALVVFVRLRYQKQIRIGLGLAAVAVGIAAYLASREVPEG